MDYERVDFRTLERTPLNDPNFVGNTKGRRVHTGPDESFSIMKGWIWDAFLHTFYKVPRKVRCSTWHRKGGCDREVPWTTEFRGTWTGAWDGNAGTDIVECPVCGPSYTGTDGG